MCPKAINLDGKFRLTNEIFIYVSIKHEINDEIGCLGI